MRYVAAVVCLAFVACSREQPLEVFSTVPSFALTSQADQPFSSSELAGKVWVANFIFTNCMGPCPRMTAQMRHVQDAVRGLEDVRLVSFTVDPARDTPQVLEAFARRHKADTGQWVFLTGPQETLHSLKRSAFLLGNVDGQLEHSTRFVLVDRQGRVRVFYDTSEEGVVKRVIRDVKRLREEKG